MGCLFSYVSSSDSDHGSTASNELYIVEYPKLKRGQAMFKKVLPHQMLNQKKKKKKNRDLPEIIRHVNPLAESYVPWSSINFATTVKDEETTMFLLSAIEKHFLFRNLTMEEKRKCLNQMELFTFQPGQKVQQEGAHSDYFFVVDKGSLEVYIQVQYQGNMHPGDVFGDIALVLDAPTESTIVAAEPSECWGLSRVAFRQALYDVTVKNRDHILDFINNMPQLQRFSPMHRVELANVVSCATFEPGRKIIKQGHTGTTMYFIQQGYCHVTQDRDVGEVHLMTITSGDYFGEGALVCPSQPRAANIFSGEIGVVCLALNREDPFSQMDTLIEILKEHFFTRVLRGIPLLKDVQYNDLRRIAGMINQEKYEPGQKIIEQGTPGNNFYFLFEGRVEVVYQSSKGNRRVCELSVGDFFGEMALINNTPRMTSVVALTDVGVGALTKESFDILFSCTMHSLLQIMADRMSALQVIEEEENAIPMPITTRHLTWEDFDVLKTLGVGSFAKVQLVRYADNGQLYALKMMKKKHVIKKGMVKYVIQERHLLTLVSHPFIVTMHAAFADDSFLYLLLDLIPGGSLNDLLLAKRPLTCKEAQFYFAGATLILEYLHQRNIVYRDFKPENLLLDSDGFLRLVDFGLSAVVTSKTFTICGTPEYMAPEMVYGKGYTKAVDNWALGVLLFEMLLGYSPFNPTGKMNEREICENITNCHYRFGKVVLVSDCQDMIKRLLDPDPTRRLGVGTAGWDEVKHHPWFAYFDWEAYNSRLMEAPHLPPMIEQTGKVMGVRPDPMEMAEELFAGWDQPMLLQDDPFQEMLPELHD